MSASPPTTDVSLDAANRRFGLERELPSVVRGIVNYVTDPGVKASIVPAFQPRDPNGERSNGNRYQKAEIHFRAWPERVRLIDVRMQDRDQTIRLHCKYQVTCSLGYRNCGCVYHSLRYSGHYGGIDHA
jgi:hypothetical protein